MSPIKRGTTDVTKIYRGGSQVTAVYRGGSQVFGGGTTVTPATIRALSTSTPGYATTASVNKPTGTAEGDLLVLFVFGDYGTAANFSPPTGFTQLVEHDLGDNLSKVNLSYKVATASEPASYSANVDSGADTALTLFAIQDWSGNTADIRAVGAASPSSNTSHSAPSVTPATGYGLAIAATEHPSSTASQTWSWTPPSGYTERSDLTSGGGYMSATTASRQWDATTAIPAASFAVTTSAAAAQGVGAQIIIPSKVSGSGGGTTTPAVFPSVRGFTQKGESGGATGSVNRTINQTSPAPVAGDLIIFVVSMTSGSATDFANMTIPTGFTQLNAHDISTNTGGTAVTTENKIRMGYKVATSSEPATYGYTVPTSYSHRADLITIKDWNNSFTPVATSAVPSTGAGISPTNSGTNPDTYNLTSVTPHNDTGLLLMTMSTRTTTATASHGFNWDWAGSGLTELTDLTGNNIQTMSTATQQWNVSTAASGKQVVLNRSTTEDRQATGVSIIIPGTPASGGGGGGGGGGSGTGDYTNGSGGELVDVVEATYYNGTKTSRYNLYAAGLDWTKDVGLLVYCDGSGDWGIDNASDPYLMAGTNGLVNVAKRNNMVLLTPFAPGDGCTDNDGVCWYLDSFDGTTTAQKIQWSRDLIDWVMGRYNIDKSRMVIGGYSSGAQWTTQFFGPAHAPAIMSDGLAIAISFGGEPIYANTFTTTFKQNVAFCWDVGDADEYGAYQGAGIYDAQSGYDWYTANGFTTTELTVVPGEDHDRTGLFGQIVEREILQHVRAA